MLSSISLRKTFLSYDVGVTSLFKLHHEIIEKEDYGRAIKKNWRAWRKASDGVH